MYCENMRKEMPTSIDFEIINIQPIDKYISECEIKVFYHGKNRNQSYISKAVGNQIANSLPRAPIVAFYNEEIGDFEDHGEEVVINKQGVKFIRKTIPYGAISEFHPIVWKKFTDANGEEKEYMVARGYLWTGRYPFLKDVVENSKGQSMEFFPESIQGNWAKFDNEDNEFFIFNEADISALCILGDDVEPCFEGATVGKPEIIFSLKEDEFKKEFNNFMLDLNTLLNHSAEGGEELLDNELEVKEPDFELEEEELELEAEFEEEPKKKKKTDEKDDDLVEEEEEDEEEDEEPEEPEGDGDGDGFSLEEEPAQEPEPNHELVDLQAKYDQLESDFAKLKADYDLLMEEKVEKDNFAKLEMCDKFSVLGEEVIEVFKSSIDDFSLEELEKELSTLAFKAGLSFSLLVEEKEDIVTPAFPSETKSVPAWIKAIENKEQDN